MPLHRPLRPVQGPDDELSPQFPQPEQVERALAPPREPIVHDHRNRHGEQQPTERPEQHIDPLETRRTLPKPAAPGKMPLPPAPTAL